MLPELAPTQPISGASNMKTTQTTPALAIGMHVVDLAAGDNMRGTVIGIGKKYVLIRCDDGEERPIEELENVGIIPAAADCCEEESRQESALPTETQEDFKLSVARALHAADSAIGDAIFFTQKINGCIINRDLQELRDSLMVSTDNFFAMH
jgi:hypothetical protein